jgi:hypothetical protein
MAQEPECAGVFCAVVMSPKSVPFQLIVVAKEKDVAPQWTQAEAKRLFVDAAAPLLLARLANEACTATRPSR